MMLFVLSMLLTLMPASAISPDDAKMGSACTKDYQCRSQLLYCSENGICTCKQDRSNLVFKVPYLFDIDAWCEVRFCSINKTLGENDCELQNAECIQNSLWRSHNFCKCPNGTVGASVEVYFEQHRQYNTKCIDFTLSTINEPCWTDDVGMRIKRLPNNTSYAVCDRHKGLFCDYKRYSCSCHKDYKFDFKQNMCVRMVGGYNNLCETTEECFGEMICHQKRCNCPPFCDRQYIIEDNICCCPNPGSIVGKILLGALGFSIVFIAILAFAYFRENKKRTRALVDQDEFSLQAGPLYLNSSNNRHAASAPPAAASAPVLYPESALPTYSSQVSDGLPTYSEATQANLKKHEVVVEHHR